MGVALLVAGADGLAAGLGRACQSLSGIKMPETIKSNGDPGRQREQVLRRLPRRRQR